MEAEKFVEILDEVRREARVAEAFVDRARKYRSIFARITAVR